MEKVIFKSVIKSNPVGRWYIELTNTLTQETQICLDIDEYAQKIELMGYSYGENIEVQWSQDDNVTQEQIDQIRVAIQEYELKQKNPQN